MHLPRVRARQQDVKVVIGGDGGDELFGGYDRYYGNLYAEHYARVPAALRRHVLGPALSLIPEAGWYKSVGHQLRWLQRLSFLDGSDRYAASLSYFYFEERCARRCSRRRRWNSCRACTRKTPSGLHSMRYRRSGGPHAVRGQPGPPAGSPGHDLRPHVDGHGLEARSPFMDHRLAEFAARLPSSLKIRGRSLR